MICKNAAPRRTKVLLAPMARCCGSVEEAESSDDGSYHGDSGGDGGDGGAAGVNKDTGKLPPHFSFTPFYAVFYL